jgi:hypothetical protein
MPKTKKKKTGSEYQISLTFGEYEIGGSGSTALAAIQSLPVPVKIVSKGLLKLTNGQKKVELMWMPAKLKRVFQPLAQSVMAKQLEYLMK